MTSSRRTAASAGASRPPARVRRRVVAVMGVLSLLFAVVVGRLAQLQIVGADRYAALGENQRIRPVELPASRGSVFDRNGNALALSVTQRTVYADPALVSDAQGAAQALAPVLGVDQVELQVRLSSAGRFVYLARQLPDETADQVEALDLDGIYLIEEPKRFMPSGDVARSLLGTVNIDNVGSAGLEKQYDDVLTGEPGQLVIERDPDGRTIPTGEHELSPATPGEDLVLSIDRSLQYEAERLVGQQVDAMGAASGTIIVSRPETGEILAMANMAAPADGGSARPTVDNRALTTVYEPGSVNKVITLAAALEEGVATPETVLSVPDRLQVADHLYKDHDPHPVADWTPSDIMATSSNIGTILLAEELGPARIDEYLRRFGFGQRSGLGFPDESAGIMVPLDDWSGTSIGSIPIGQGVAVTAMQMLSAYNVIANGGVFVEPRVVLATVDENGERRPNPVSRPRRVISETVADQVRDMMVTVVDQGTGSAAAVEGYRVAGKTGTARKPLATGGYQDGAGNYHYVTTFAGFVPAEEPQLSIIVVIDEPSATIFASAVSAPVFAEMARYGLRLLQIPPPDQILEPSVPAPTAGLGGDGATNELPGGRTQPTAEPTTSTTAPAGPDPPET